MKEIIRILKQEQAFISEKIREAERRISIATVGKSAMREKMAIFSILLL